MTDAEIRRLQAQYPTENDPLPFARALIDHIEQHLEMVSCTKSRETCTCGGGCVQKVEGF